MTAPSPVNPQNPIVSEYGDTPALPVQEIDRACRLPVMILFTAAVLWLAFGSLLGVITAIKAHGPGFLAAPAWLTYGRVRPAALNAFVYGFLFQAGLGMTLWMFCRLGQNFPVGRRIITAATALWNVGLVMGIVGILAGAATGYEWLEMPRMATPTLFLAFVLMAGWSIVTLHVRRQRELYVSQWFLLTALLWFPGIYSTAQLLLVFFPVRGVVQSVINGWYVHNLVELCLAPLGLAAIFYFLPKLSGRPLYSRALALFGFWMIVMVGGWGGVKAYLPVPNWLSSVGYVARVFLTVGIVAFAISWFRTLAGSTGPRPNIGLRFMVVAACSYLLAGGLEVLGTHPGMSTITTFTLFDEGITLLKLHGFLGMALSAAVYYIAPRVAGCEWRSPSLIRLHFWCATIGFAIAALALVVGGMVQGSRINQPETDFVSIVRGTVPFLGMNTLGTTLLLLGYGLLTVNLVRLVTACCPCGAFMSRFQTVRSGVSLQEGARV